MPRSTRAGVQRRQANPDPSRRRYFAPRSACPADNAGLCPCLTLYRPLTINLARRVVFVRTEPTGQIAGRRRLPGTMARPSRVSTKRKQPTGRRAEELVPGRGRVQVPEPVSTVHLRRWLPLILRECRADPRMATPRVGRRLRVGRHAAANAVLDAGASHIFFESGSSQSSLQRSAAECSAAASKAAYSS